MSELVTAAMNHAFVAHGLPSTRADAGVRVDGDLFIHAHTHLRSHEPEVMLQLDVVVETPLLGISGPLVDSFAGLGPTEREAEKNAFGKFLLGSFHVLAESLTSHRCDSEQVEWESWKAPAHAWRVCSGPLLTQGMGQSETAQQYGEVLRTIQGQVTQHVSAGPHWLRLFVAFLNGQLSGAEAILDGEPWREGEAILRRASWSPAEGYESIRHLLVLLPAIEPNAAQEGPTAPPESRLRQLLGRVGLRRK